MAILHTVNKNHPDPALASCLEVMGDENGTLLLIENGVYNAVIGSSGSELLMSKMQSGRFKCSLLFPDVRARGLEGRLLNQCPMITDEEFVAMVVAHDKTVSWF